MHVCTNIILFQLFEKQKAGRNVLITIAMTTEKFIIGAASGERHARAQVRTQCI